MHGVRSVCENNNKDATNEVQSSPNATHEGNQVLYHVKDNGALLVHHIIGQQKVSTNGQYEEPSKHMISIGNHEKGMKMHFQPPHNEMKYVLCIKESYSKGKKGQNFHIWEPAK